MENRERERDDGFERCAGCKSDDQVGDILEAGVKTSVLLVLTSWLVEGRSPVQGDEMRTEPRLGEDRSVGISLLMGASVFKIPPSHLSAGGTPASPIPMKPRSWAETDTLSSLSSTVLAMQVSSLPQPHRIHTAPCCLCHVCSHSQRM